MSFVITDKSNRDKLVVLQSNDVSDDNVMPRFVDEFTLTQHLR